MHTHTGMYMYIHTGDGIIKIPIWARFCLKNINFDKNHQIVNKHIEVVKLEILKVKAWFCDKDLSSLDSIN